MSKTLNPLGWGFTEDALVGDERKAVLRALRGFFPKGLPEAEPAPDPATIPLPPSRIQAPNSLSQIVQADQPTRLQHAAGRSFKDLVSLRSGRLQATPDLVAHPTNEDDLAQLLAWCSDAGHAVIPFGGGTSVVGGVTPAALDSYPGIVTVNLSGLNRVLDIDRKSQLVRAQGGILGPDLDAALAAQGLTVRHFPQSYLHSTLGGWVATRSAGHFSTGEAAKIEDRVQSLTVRLADGRALETRGLPADSIGPAPNRLFAGSEGFLGIITEVSLRVLRPPTRRETSGIGFKTFEEALEAAREILQAGLRPAQLRILDPFEHLTSALFAGRSAQGALMVLGFESPGPDISALHQAALEICRGNGGQTQQSAGGESGIGNWRQTFFRQPYIRDLLLDFNIIADTFETAVPWSRVPDFYHAVRKATLDAVLEVGGSGGVNCRVTHAYPDGLCLYFSFFARGSSGQLTQQFQTIRDAGAHAVLAGGGTMSHHHAMGRDHRDLARQEIPAPYRAAIRAAKSELDPGGIMNPGLWFAD